MRACLWGELVVGVALVARAVARPQVDAPLLICALIVVVVAGGFLAVDDFMRRGR